MSPELIKAYQELLSILQKFPHNTNMYFLRHGQTDNNKNRIAQGSQTSNTPMNRKGNLDVHESGKKLEMNVFDACFTSPALRAKQAFEIVRNYFVSYTNLQFELPELEEINWGDGIDGKPMNETRYQELNDEFFVNKNYEARFDNNENILDIIRRATLMFNNSLNLINEKIELGELKIEENRNLELLYTGHGFFFGIILTAIIDSVVGLNQKPQTAGLKMLTIKHDQQHILQEL